MRPCSAYHNNLVSYTDVDEIVDQVANIMTKEAEERSTSQLWNDQFSEYAIPLDPPLIFLFNTRTIVQLRHTVETRIKEPTFLSDNLLKALIFCLYNPYIRDEGSVSLIKTCIDCISIAVAFSPIIYFIFKAIFVKILY